MRNHESLHLKVRHSPFLPATRRRPMERLHKFIQELSAHELQQIKTDLDNDSKYLRHMIGAQLLLLETGNCKVCANCGSQILEAQHTNLTLTFGPADFRKKATLCGMDCMEGFLARIKRIDEKLLTQNRINT